MRRFLYVYIIAASLAFAALARLSWKQAYFHYDPIITHQIQALASPRIISFFEAVSWPGYLPQLSTFVAAVVLILLLFRQIKSSLIAFICFLFLSVIVLGVKIQVDRVRPDNGLVQVYLATDTSSFPSGHMATYTFIFGFLAFMAYLRISHPHIKYPLVILLSLPIPLVAISRVILGLHWPSDILGGFLLGSSFLATSIHLHSPPDS